MGLDSGLARRPRVGLFGGSFDPVHLAHLALARSAFAELDLDELRWQPAGQPWQKTGQTGRVMTEGRHRAAMIELLIAGESGFVLDDIELRRPGASYTIDTVRAVAAAAPGAQLFLVIGQDQYARLNTWNCWQELLRSVTLAVAARAGEAVSAPAALQGFEHDMVRLQMPAMNISSSGVRASVSRGENIRPLVGDAVAEYIALHRLYETTHEY
ncbi:nicotinate-nucleotide adenylyltransferase [Roseateles toxinivorans]|uniref:Probable nicotinate-nucleotide adenylyltransferase n=1 Tax=Roseateles toxinivorans TaxID=270368 RepID=A0A4V3CT61_9BURK|nr:nicotinate-nucleotide adenylyltransferase [Roseateles toxinivorans]TDP63994.1 nicotinate-nucleotide adenylyltransferase [Roseateles toxinivorans]